MYCTCDYGGLQECINIVFFSSSLEYSYNNKPFLGYRKKKNRPKKTININKQI